MPKDFSSLSLSVYEQAPSPAVNRKEGSISFGPEPRELLQAGSVLLLRSVATGLSAFWYGIFKDSCGCNWGAYLLHKFYERMIEGLDANASKDAYLDFSSFIA